jgi:hypothetical protein
MKVVKSVDLDRDGEQITTLFESKVRALYGPSDDYNNNMQVFLVMLQEVADKAFELGQEKGV